MMIPHLPFLKRYLFTLRQCARLFTIGVLNHAGRQHLKAVGHVFGYPRTAGPLPVVGIDRLTPDVQVGQILEVRQRPHHITVFELMALCIIARALRPRRIFELGTWDGRTTLNLAANSPDDATVYTLDLEPAGSRAPSGAIVGDLYMNTPYASKIEQLQGNTLAFDFSPYYGQMDLVFVDAGHAYKNVANDSEVASRLVRDDGGVIVWHDYRLIDDVTRRLDELHARGGVWGDLKHIDRTFLACLSPNPIGPVSRPDADVQAGDRQTARV